MTSLCPSDCSGGVKPQPPPRAFPYSGAGEWRRTDATGAGDTRCLPRKHTGIMTTKPIFISKFIS